MVRVSRTEEEVCQLPEPEDILFPEPRTYSGTKLLCEKVGGQMTVVNNNHTLMKLVDTFKKKAIYMATKAEDGMRELLLYRIC